MFHLLPLSAFRFPLSAFRFLLSAFCFLLSSGPSYAVFLQNTLIFWFSEVTRGRGPASG
jgi:hypothetical protein